MAHLLNTSFIPNSTSLRRHSPVLPQLIHKKTLIQSKIREIFMPALSSTMTEGKIVSWIKSERDKLSKGESVVVVELDKADMDVETFYDGYLAVIMVEEGGVAVVGSAIGLLAETEDEINQVKSKASSSPSSSSAAVSDSPPPPPPVEVVADSVPSPTPVAKAAPATTAASSVQRRESVSLI